MRALEVKISHIQRMLHESGGRLHDAHLLDSSIDKRSDSSSIIKVLAFEVLLKCALYANDTVWTAQIGHDYCKLWNLLPQECQTFAVEKAAHRRPGKTDFTDIEALLTDFNRVFTRARYNYEFYEGKTLGEQTEIGNNWIQRGADLSEAKIRYRPHEIFCLTEAMMLYLDERLKGFISQREALKSE